ncbi:hypothetical protein AWB75_06018 [Caballeronia catudaia]|uniref:Toxin VasX N-terminal region domain-containing protein n=1 Tax=Caballeronia catudaia TaxID=1777136 RepID=A0A158D145_9BURK|nr:T6SS effector BTH_I2691 family protein [Caballeronia catudaia]SAK88070.1 hypothetical protein AWB75_06018 [Caballeronia catudaia]
MAIDNSASCDNCKKAGLPILPVRYTVVPKVVSAHLPSGISGEQVNSVKLTEHNYALRTLREGWLYLFYAKGARGRNYWEAYKVTEDGRIWKQSLPLPATPVTHPSCAKAGVAVPMEIIAIEQPEKCGEVFIAFSEHSWHKETFKRYAQDEKLRRQRMQCIEPAKWAAGGTNTHAVTATQQSIDQVIEYMPGLDSKLLNPGQIKNLSKEDGTYDTKLIRREATRYPLKIRQATPASASKQLVDVMNDVGKNKGAQPHPPMLLALWDAVGNAHELNGFRNDAMSMLDVYVRERAQQVDAMQSIDSAEIAVRNGAVASKSAMRSAMAGAVESMKRSGGGLGSDGFLMPSMSDDDYKAIDQAANKAGEISPAEAKLIGEAKWNSEYLPKLNLGKLMAFRPWFASVQGAITNIQANRAPDVGAWLKAPLFIATLNDYHDDNLACGIAFAAVIAEAVTGLGSEAKGEQILFDLVNNMDPTQPESVVWRAFASNQKKPKDELKEVLEAATKYKETPWQTFTGGLDSIGIYLDKLKSFTDFRDKMGEVTEHEFPVSGTERALKAMKVDRLVMVIATPLFKWTGLGKFSDCTGAFMIRGALMMHAGIARADAIGLVKQSARTELVLSNKLRAEFLALRLQGVKAGEAYTKALMNVADAEEGKLLRAKWNAVRLTPQGDAAATGMRLAGTLAIIELFSFGSILAKENKSGEDYALLVASGFSSTSACLQLPMKAMATMAKDAAGTLANLKAITGYCSGASSMIGAVLDFRKAVLTGKKGDVKIALAYFVKSALGAGAASANLLTALTSSAPMIARATGGKGLVWLGKANAGMAGATARTAELARATEAGVSAAARREAADLAGKAAVGAVAEEVGIVVGERGALLLLGRAVLFLAGWEVAVVLMVIQFLVWYFSDNDLQTWLEKCWFGKSPNNPLWDSSQQRAEFDKALAATGLKSEEVTQ